MQKRIMKMVGGPENMTYSKNFKEFLIKEEM